MADLFDDTFLPLLDSLDTFDSFGLGLEGEPDFGASPSHESDRSMASPASSEDYASDAADQLFAELQSSDFNFDNLHLTKAEQDEEEDALRSIFEGEETRVENLDLTQNVDLSQNLNVLQDVDMSQIGAQKKFKGTRHMIVKVQVPVPRETYKRLTSQSSPPKVQEPRDVQEPRSVQEPICVQEPRKAQEPTKVVFESAEDIRKRNAEAARQNRLKKKQHLQGLEERVDLLEKENTSLKKEKSKMQTAITSLEEEVEYLKSVLANQSALSSLLKNIDTTEGVALSTSFPSNRKRKAGEADHDYSQRKKTRHTDNSGGVCLHVNKDQVSLEFCSKCAHMAIGGERQ